MSPEDVLEGVVRIASPTGHEADAVTFMRAQAKRDGFRVLDDSVGNFVAEIGKGTNLVLFVGHIDTVPGTIPVRREGRTLWGRGSVDAKGPLVAAYAAALRHKDDTNLRFLIVGAVDEEGNSRGAYAIPKDLDPRWIIIGEPSGVHGLTLGYKGIVRGDFRVARRRTHGASRDPTAAESAVAFWRTLEAHYKFADHYDTIQGRLDSINSETDGLLDRTVAKFNVRLPPDVDPDRIVDELMELGRAHDVQVTVDERMMGALAPKRSDLVATFLSVIRARGGQPILKKKTGTADFNIFARRHPGVPIVAYGPGDASFDHTPEERIELADLTGAVDILDDVFTRLGGSVGTATPAAQPTNGRASSHAPSAPRPGPRPGRHA